MKTLQIVSIIRQSGLKINYNHREGSRRWKQTVNRIVEAIRMTYGDFGYSDKDIIQGIVLDVMQEYKNVGHILRMPKKHRTPKKHMSTPPT